MKTQRYRLAILATHPIQYYVPWYKALAEHPKIDLSVFYCHNQSSEDHAKAGFNVAFQWDISLLDGYHHQFLDNISKKPNVYDFYGCDTPEIEKTIHARKFDAFIIHGWYTKSTWQAIRACWKNGTPILIRGDSHLLTRRSILKQIVKFPLYRWFIPKFDAYLVVGQRNKEYYLYYGAKEEKMYFVPHAVDNDFFQTRCLSLKDQQLKLRQAWNIPPDAIVFLFAAKLINKKRPQDFIKALANSQKKDSRIWGLIVGDGPLRKELESIALAERANLLYAGFQNQSEMPKAYTVADALVIPSDGGETWGLVVNEAMACSLPVIASTQVGCVPDLVLPGQTGDIFQTGQVDDLADIITRFADSPSMIRQLGENAARHIQRYSIPVAVEGTLQAIQEVISGANNA